MQIADAPDLAPILSSGPLNRGRKCQRRNLARRLKKGRTTDLRKCDLHYIRQARFIARLGRSEYDRLHVREIQCREIR